MSTLAPSTPNELLKYGGSDSRFQGSGLLCDSSRHLSHIARLTLDSGISFSGAGLDLASYNIARVNELEVEVLHAKRIVTPAVPVPVPVQAPLELPDDMVVDNLQSQEIVVQNVVLPKLTGCSALGTDSNGTIIRAQSICPVPGPDDQIPRFVGGTIAASPIKVDSAGNLSGTNNIDCFQLTTVDTIHTDTLQASSVATKTLTTDKVTWNQRFQESNATITLFVSNGAFQPIGMSGEGCYVCNLRVNDFSIWLQAMVGKTKTIYRSSFGGGIGGIKSTQLEEHESDGGFDFVLMSIPDVGKLSFGVDQKTGEFHIRSDQNELMSVRLILQKLTLFQ